MAKNGVLAFGGVLVFALAIAVIVLAALYGVKHNCGKEDVTVTVGIQAVNQSTNPSGGTQTANQTANSSGESKPTMIHFPRIMDSNVTKLFDTAGSNSFMKTIAYSPVPGKEMRGGVFRLDAGAPLEYTQWYESILFVLSGEFNITDGTGQSFLVRFGDSIYAPRGSKVTYRTSLTSFLYFVMQPPCVSKCAEIRDAIASNPAVVRYNNTMNVSIPLYVNEFNSSSYLQDLMVSNITGVEMAGGLYKLLAGPALDYTYEYEEFKYIVDGEFQLTDGTGKFVSAKGGDLMYFPKGTFVHFTSPNYALGFYVGQREGGTA